MGDIVPSGSTTGALGALLPPFFVANVLLVPAVEELAYRGLAFDRLRAVRSPGFAVAVTTIAFGLLHWLGGIWYVLATALVVGLPFALLRARGRSLRLVFVAHLTLNVVEFVAIALAWR